MTCKRFMLEETSNTTTLIMEETTRMSNMDALLYILILEVSLLQMKLLERSAFRSVQQMNLNKKHKQQCYKLSSDRTFFKNVIRTTLLEIVEDGKFSTLHRAVEILNKSSSTFTSIQLRNNDLKLLVENSDHELISKRHHWEMLLRQSEEKIASLKDQIKDSLLNAKARLCYAEKWMSAEAEALEFRFQIKPSLLPKQDHEQRIHNEIVRTYELQTKEREELLSFWKVKYREDTVNLNDRVIQQREKFNVAAARRLELQKTFDYHAGEMRAWLTFKRERAARLAREACARAAATRIQSWWRGLMVRRALGAFRHLRNSKKSVAKKQKK